MDTLSQIISSPGGPLLGFSPTKVPSSTSVLDNTPTGLVVVLKLVLAHSMSRSTYSRETKQFLLCGARNVRVLQYMLSGILTKSVHTELFHYACQGIMPDQAIVRKNGAASGLVNGLLLAKKRSPKARPVDDRYPKARGTSSAPVIGKLKSSRTFQMARRHLMELQQPSANLHRCMRHLC